MIDISVKNTSAQLMSRLGLDGWCLEEASSTTRVAVRPSPDVVAYIADDLFQRDKAAAVRAVVAGVDHMRKRLWPRAVEDLAKADRTIQKQAQELLMLQAQVDMLSSVIVKMGASK